MAWRGEVEDGTGWSGLVASKAEQRAEARQAALEKDAARYRWLRDKARTSLAVSVVQCMPGEMDAAFDMAMRAR